MNDDVAILCSGPSFSAFLSRPCKHDLYIGVNRTVEAFVCDWWVFNDHQALSFFSPLRSSEKRPLRLFCGRATHQRAIDRRLVQFADYAWTYFEECDTTCRSDHHWQMFSMTAAMVLADYLGAKRVTIYGCDWKGKNDWGGPPPTPFGRSDYRWNNERHWYGHIAAWLESRGITCERRFSDVEQEQEAAAGG